MTCGIYKITSPSGKVYIGQSVDCDAIKAFQATRSRIVQQFDLDGVLLCEARIRGFAKQGHSQGNISSCCTGRLKTHHGYVFKYKEAEQ